MSQGSQVGVSWGKALRMGCPEGTRGGLCRFLGASVLVAVAGRGWPWAGCPGDRNVVAGVHVGWQQMTCGCV